MKHECKDADFMKRALALAARGRGKTFPNPMVGAVIVKKGSVIGEGYHKGPGTEHAETAAIRNAAKGISGAEMYVNLEPCVHYGRTPPCADEIIKAGIRRVVCAMRDPDPRVAGRGFARLSRAGIEVETNLLGREAARLNEVYSVNRTESRPFITIKSAMTLDGKIATSSGLSRWITSEQSRDFVHSLRAASDGILTGIGTVEKDDPLLTPRKKNITRAPYRIILDFSGRAPPGARIFSEDPGRVLIASRRKTKNLEKTGAFIIECPGKEGRVRIDYLFRQLLRMGISTVLVEAGGEINASILQARMADRVYLFYAPKIFCGKDAPTSFGGRGAQCPGEAVGVEISRIRRLGNDILVEGVPAYPGGGGIRCSPG